MGYGSSGVSKALNIYHCGREQCAPLHSFGPAVRTHYLIHVVLDGKGQYYESGKVHSLKKGDVFLICPGTSTYYIADKEEPWEYAWVGFDGYECQDILESCGLLCEEPIFWGSNNEKNRNCPEHLSQNIILLEECFERNGHSTFELLGYLYLFFSVMCGQKQKNHLPSYENQYFQQACEYIKHNYSYDIKVKDIAKFVGIDRTYLYKIFKEKEKISPQQYLLKYRLNIATNMLVYTELNVTEVAYSNGFSDAPSFCKHFKKQTGITPLQYRKQKNSKTC